MKRGLCGLACCLLLIAVGCSGSADEYRTYSEGSDGDASIAQAAETSGDAVGDESQAVGTPVTAEPMPADASGLVEPVVGDTADRARESVQEAGSRPPGVPLPERLALADDAGGASFTSVTSGGESREIKLLVPEKEFPRLDSGQTLRVSFDDIDLLKVLNMDPVPADCVDHFPEWLKGLDGHQIRIRGFMIPQTRGTGLPGFEIARDTQLCCFGREPKPYDVFPVLLKEGTSTKYIHMRPFDVVGRFAIRPYTLRGKIMHLYEIEGAEIIEQ